MTTRIIAGDCLEVIPQLVAEGVHADSVVTDPPYHLSQAPSPLDIGSGWFKERSVERKVARTGFMNSGWDGGDIAFQPETWRTCFDILKPGGYLLAFGGTRGHHRIWCAIEDAGFVIQDTILDMVASDSRVQAFLASLNDEQRGAFALAISESPMLAWCFGSGFPKGRTQLKPAFEPIICAYKPSGKRSLSVDECRVHQSLGDNDHVRHNNVSLGSSGSEIYGKGKGFVGGRRELQIDECRILTNEEDVGDPFRFNGQDRNRSGGWLKPTHSNDQLHAERQRAAFERMRDKDRWPANVCHDGSEQVMEAFAAFEVPGQQGDLTGNEPSECFNGVYSGPKGRHAFAARRDGGVSPARFFYSAKADNDFDRFGSKHPTVKPVELMKWLVQLVTPKGGTCLDPFAGSGTTGVAAMATGRNAILVEQSPEYIADIRERMAFYEGQGRHALVSKNRNKTPRDELPLFA